MPRLSEELQPGLGLGLMNKPERQAAAPPPRWDEACCSQVWGQGALLWRPRAAAGGAHWAGKQRSAFLQQADDNDREQAAHKVADVVVLATKLHGDL